MNGSRNERQMVGKVWAVFALVQAVCVFATAPSFGAVVNKKLNGLLANNEDVADFRISADGNWVIYRAGRLNTAPPIEPSNESLNLFSVAIEGGPAVRLNGLLPTDSTVHEDYAISPDSQRVVYRAEQDEQDKTELYSVPIQGPTGTAVKLNRALPPYGNVGSDSTGGRGFRISPNAARVVYWANQDSVSDQDLYSVPIEGPADAGVRLNEPLEGYGITGYSYRISPDGQWVVYYAAQDDQDKLELYCVPIDGPSTDVIKLNGLMVVGGNMYAMEISPDSTRVVYSADQQVDDQIELYSVPIRGPAGAGQKLNGNLPTGGDVSVFAISPNSQWVAYRADQETENQAELYGVPIGGTPGGGQRISQILAVGTVVSLLFSFSPDSSRVAYGEWNLSSGIGLMIYSTPIAGPPTAAVPLTKPLVSGGGIFLDFKVSAGAERVVYRADQDTDEVYELYSVPFEGPADGGVKINPDLGAYGDVTDFRISPDGLLVAYRADRARISLFDDIFRLWTVPVEGPTTANVVHGPSPVSGGDVSRKFEFAPDGRRLVYIADQDTDNVDELYADYDQPAAVWVWVGYK